jgi:hypothetical protein
MVGVGYRAGTPAFFRDLQHRRKTDMPVCDEVIQPGSDPRNQPRSKAMKTSIGRKWSTGLLALAVVLVVPVYAAKHGGPGMMDGGKGGMMGDQRGGMMQMSGMMRDMSGQMKGMAGDMSKGGMSAAQQKQMGERMREMAGMMDNMSGMMGKGMTMDAPQQKQMDQMRKQMDGMMKGPATAPKKK